MALKGSFYHKTSGGVAANFRKHGQTQVRRLIRKPEKKTSSQIDRSFL